MDMNNFLQQAAACLPPACKASQRVLLYNMAENIANQLTLYIWNGQSNAVYDYATWINPAGINSNPMVGGGGDQTWYTWEYANGSY